MTEREPGGKRQACKLAAASSRWRKSRSRDFCHRLLVFDEQRDGHAEADGHDGAADESAAETAG